MIYLEENGDILQRNETDRIRFNKVPTLNCITINFDVGHKFCSRLPKIQWSKREDYDVESKDMFIFNVTIMRKGTFFICIS